MIRVFGYSKGCPACDELKELLHNHKIEFTFTEVPKLTHAFKSVPQTFCGSQYIGDYGFWLKHLKGDSL